MPTQTSGGQARRKRFSGLRKLGSMLLIVSTLFFSTPAPAYAIVDAIGDAIGGVVDSVVGSVLGSVLGAIPGLGFITSVIGLSNTLANFAGAFGPISNLVGGGIGIPYAQYMDDVFGILNGTGALPGGGGTGGLGPLAGLEKAERLYQIAQEAATNPALQPPAQNQTVEDAPVWSLSGAIGSVVGNTVTDGIDWIVKSILYGILVAEGFLVTGAVKVFALVVDAQILTNVFNQAGQQLYNMWQIMRDLVSFFFILVLVFIGLATVFQVDSYNYRRMLLPLILSALLVNFSWPISRAVMDAGNIPMYWMLQQMTTVGTNSPCGYNQGAETILGNDLLACPIKQLMVPDSAGEARTRSYGFLVFSVIYLFIFAITLIILAIQLFVRVVALALIMVISPIGFVGMILPGARSLGGRWWHALFQYTFFGPVAILLLLIASQFVFIVGTATPFGFNALTTFPQDAIASMNDTSNTSARIGSALVILSIPIIVLFYAIKLGGMWSIAAAGAAVGIGYGAGRFVGKVAQSPAKGAWMGLRATGIPGGMQKAWQSGRLARFINPNAYKKATAARESYHEARFSGASGKEAAYRVKQQKSDAMAKQYSEWGRSKSDTYIDLSSNDETKRLAAVKYAVSKDGMIGSAEDVARLLDAARGDETLASKILDKIPKGSVETGAALTSLVTTINSKAQGESPLLQQDTASAAVHDILDKGADDSAFKSIDVAGYAALKQSIGTSKDAEKIQKKLDKKIRGSGNAKVLVDYAVDIEKKPVDTAYHEVIDKLSEEELGKQAVVFHKEPAVLKIMRKRKPAEQQRILSKASSGELRELWSNEGVLDSEENAKQKFEKDMVSRMGENKPGGPTPS